ncbi:MAG: oxidoreductase [Micrococcales bacterium]|nr:oxidoreductase [Micrococcales bacterium]
MSWTTRDIPSQQGRVAVVTGANGGVGLAAARALAAKGAHVVMAARNQSKARSAKSDILAADPAAAVEIVELDLGSLASVDAAAKAILARHDQIDVLLNNAGVMAVPEGKTADGFETQFGTNHLGHWALTAHLMPALLNADAARVVSMTSVAHHLSRGVDADNPHLHGSYDPWRAYNQSKLATYHFGLGLQQALSAAGVSASSLIAHPGLTNSDLQSTTQAQGAGGFIGWFSEKWAKAIGMSTDQGALPALRAATDPAARGGAMYAPRFITNGAAVRRPILRPGNRKAIATLWAVSERETGIELRITPR